MEEEIPKGFAKVALAAITNSSRTIFYLQQKDETYPLEDSRLSYTFFGGHVSPGESVDDTFGREMFEELEDDVAKLIIARGKKVLVYSCELPFKREFHLFESQFSGSELEALAKQKVKEGKGGFLIKREELAKTKVMPAIRMLMENYLSQYDNNL